MTPSRRQVLTGLGAGGLALTGASRLAWAPPPPPPALNGICAVHFDGSTYLQCPAADLDFPEFGQYIFVHAKINCPFATTGATHTLFDLGLPGGGSIFRTKLYTGNQKGKAGLQIGATGGGSGVGVISPPGSLPAKQWFDLKFSIDTTAGIMIVTINDGPVPGLAPVPGYTQPFSVPFWNSPIAGGGSAPLYWGVGRSVFPTPASWSVGDQTDLCIAVTSSFIDPTDQTIKDRFTDPATGVPVRHATNGRSLMALGQTVSTNDILGIWLSGPKTLYPLNLIDHPFSETGSFTVTGTLTPAAIDPWLFTGA